MLGKSLLLIGLLSVTGWAIAKWVGRFYCGPTCEVGAGPANGDTFDFIKAEVNKKVASWVDAKNRPNQVTICNGTKCSLYTAVVTAGVFVSEGYWYSDWKGDGTVGSGGSGGVGGTGGPIGGDGDNPWQDCISGTKTGEACTSVDGGPKQCVTVDMPALICPGIG